MSSQPEVSVVAATHNRPQRLQALLDGLRAQTLGHDRFEVVIVDDGSGPETTAVLDAAQARGDLPLRVYRQETAGGPARARNRGWREAHGPVIAFTDDDCVPTPGWLEALMAAGADRPDAIVQGATGPNPDELDALDAFAKTVRVSRATPHFETCNVSYPRAVLERLGGFDESYPAPAGEDSDLGWRALQDGATQLFAPDAVVHHAVHVRPPVAALRDALMATHGVQAYKQNPDLRQELTQGVFYDRSHPLLLQALLGGFLARRQPVALAFALPYALNVRSRARLTNTPLQSMAFTVVYDVVQIGATVRGAIRHRFFVL